MSASGTGFEALLRFFCIDDFGGKMFSLLLNPAKLAN
jgi:hypothetical protein